MSMWTVPILYHCRFLLSLFCIISWSNHFIDLVGAATTTIDDAATPAFTFVSAWNAITPSDPCHGCAVKLDSDSTFDGTWHDGSVAGSTASLNFDGTGVTLYGVTNADQTCALTFVLDGGSPVNLDLSTIPSSPTKVYNYPFFTSSGLSSGSHTLSWTIENSVDNAVALIDYAVVTSDEPTSTSSSSSTSSEDTSSIGESPTVTVTQTDSSSSSATPSSSAASSASSSISSSSSGASLGAVSSTATGTSTNSSSGSSSMPVTTAPTSPASSSAVLITIGTSVSTSMVLSSTSTSGLVTALGTKKSKTVIVVGAVVGGTMGLLLIAVIFFLLIRRKRRQIPPSAIPGIEAFRYYRHLEGEARAEVSPPVPEKMRRSLPLSRNVSTSPSKVSISRLPSTNRSPPPLPHMNMDESRTNPTSGSGYGLESSINGSTAQPITGAEPSAIISAQQMEQRILNLERMLRQADEAENLLHDISPPPYLSE